MPIFLRHDSRSGKESRLTQTRTPGQCVGIIITALVIAAGGLIPAVDAATEPSAPDTLKTQHTPEGPHIVWQNDSQATVFYVCDDTIASQQFIVRDTLRFAGFCHDSAASYAVPRELTVPDGPIFTGVSRILTVSDLHGEFAEFVDFLLRAGAITRDLVWNWGDGHLVIVGDVFDRGDEVTECFWLIHRLEQEAPIHGGRVHMLLGNHEEMVLRGDLRYVNDKYTDGICRASRIPYDDLYGPDTEIGRWLRTKPTAVTINGVLFAHAGIPPRVLDASLSLAQLNDSVRAYLDLSQAQLAFSDWPKYIYSGAGPLWYRGYFEEREGGYPLATESDIDQTLAFYNVQTIVVGHSEQDHVTPLFHAKVIAVDVPVDELGGFEGLLWEGGILSRVLVSGEVVPLDSGSTK